MIKESTSSMRTTLFITILICFAIGARLLPVVPNFTPITALAVFAGFTYSRKTFAIFLPMFVMFVSDSLLAFVKSDSSYIFHADMFAVYATFAFIAISSFILSRFTSTTLYKGSAVIVSSLIFFLTTNFSVWLTSGMYTLSFSGLAECYTMALPFLRNSMLADALYATALFASYYIYQSTIRTESSSVQKA